MYDAIVTPLFIGHLALVFLPGSHVIGSHWIPTDMIIIVISLFIGHLTSVFLPGSYVSGSHWIPVNMINIRPPMHSFDWSIASYIRQSLLLLWEKALVSVVTHREREI